MFGEKIAHGTTFRRAVEEGLLDLKRVVQIGQRAQGYAAGDFQWGVDQGFRLVQAEQCWHKSLAPLMAEVRQQMGDGPVYLSFDIDSLDPIWARNRHAGSRRPDLHSGAGNRPRLPRPEPDWRDLVEVSPPTT
jgi:arginase family enzyme